MPAGRHAGRPSGRQVGRQDGWNAGRLADQQAGMCTLMRVYGYAHSRADMPTSILKRGSIPHFRSSFGSLGIGKRCFESRNNSVNSNPFSDGFLISREISKVSFELLKGFSVTSEKWKQQGMF